jgi:protease-4
VVSVPGKHPYLLLEIDLTGPLVEVEPDDLVGRLRDRHRPRLRALLRALHEAGDDRHVRGVVMKLGSASLGWATMQELRVAVTAFRRSGKPVLAWAESLGEAGRGTVDYVLATACSEIWLQPSGELALLGVASETTFLRGALDKIGVEPQLAQRHEYKNAADRVMGTEFTAAHREAVEHLVGSVWSGAVTMIAAGRGMPETEVSRLADRSPLAAAEARDSGLVDHLGYRDEVVAAARRHAGGSVEPLFADQWTPRRRAATLIRRYRDFVALVDAHGQIGSGRSSAGRKVGSDTVGAALRAVRRNDHARAVLLRVDSPGGSAVASDTIWREVALTRDAGKPVVVSMGALAASGGYYIASPADAIVALPATLTGSIGVYGGKAVVSGLLDRLGLSTGVVARGANARMYSSRERFTDAELARLDALLDRIYADFVQKVADGRGMTYDAVHEIARGRVWTGADAAANGLVDVVGGGRDAADLARQRAGLRSDAPVRPAVHVPPLARLGRARNSDDPRAVAATATDWGDLGALAAALGLPEGGALRMPELRLR